MGARDRAREQVAELVARYKRLSARERRDYSEEEVKQGFLLPLFRALGWDVENREDVRAEERVGEGKADYSFRINGIPAFFLEAKRFSSDLNDAELMKQAINYAWLKGTTWAVLSNFERLLVFNADWDEDYPQRSRVLDLNYAKYLTSDFDDLWLLSRSEMEVQELDRFTERYGLKNKREPVNRLLLADLTRWRRDLFAEMRREGTTLWQRDDARVDEAVQRFLDRLIFIRTVEDRRVEENMLRAALRQYTSNSRRRKRLFYEELTRLFRKLDDYYNSRLFYPHALDTEFVVNDVSLLGDVINGLYDARGLATYNFAAIDADMLGAVYEQYLGFRAMDPAGEQELDLGKKQKRKALGIYYTPIYVVRYIVNQTLGKLLTDQSMTAERAHRLRILDPACGSGSFLIEAFRVLDEWLSVNGDEIDRNHHYRRRRRILEENLYGVDLDPQAGEVTRLNLLLHAARQRETLPMLHNIKRGNSLIDDPALTDDAFDWNDLFSEIMSDGGFDVVIGNPPYGAQLSPSEKDWFTNNYKHQNYQLDTYMLFMERSIQLVKPGMYWGMIVPNPWLTNIRTKKIRQFMFKETKIDSIVHFKDKVFQDATVDTEIIVTKRENCVENAVQVLVSSERRVLSAHYADQKRWLDAGGDTVNIFVDENALHLFDKISLLSKPLKSVCKVTNGIKPYSSGRGIPVQTPAIVKSRIYDADHKVDDSYRQYLRGKDITRYSVSPRESRWIKYGSCLAEPRFATNFDAQEKLFIRQTGDRPIVALDTKQLLGLNNLHIIVLLPGELYSLHFVLGCLNSKLASWYYSVLNPEQGEALAELKLANVEKLPVFQLDFTNASDLHAHDSLVSLVNRLISTKQEFLRYSSARDDRQHELQQQVARLDAQIDAQVHALYGLSAEEIALVEGRAD